MSGRYLWRKTLKWLGWSFAVLTLTFAALLFSSPLWQRRWIAPAPGVRLEPARPILRREDMPPGGGFELFEQVCKSLQTNRPSFETNGELRKLAAQRWSETAFPHAAKWLMDNREVLAKAAQAAAKWEETQVPTVTDFHEMREMIAAPEVEKLFAIDAAQKLEQGDFAHALDDLLSARRFAEIPIHGGPDSYRLAGNAVELFAETDIRRAALLYDLPSDVTQRAMHDLEMIDARFEPLVETVRFEALVWQGRIPEFYAEFRNSMGAQGTFFPPWMRTAVLLGPFVGSTPESTRKNLECAYAHLIAAMEQGFDHASVEQLRAIFPPMPRNRQPLADPVEDVFDEIFGERPEPLGKNWYRTRDPVGYGLAYMAIPVGISAAKVRTEYRVYHRATEMVLAVRQFAISNGRLPASLGELVSKYTAHLPLDPFDDQPMRYRLFEDGTWCVYSVGPNRKDDLAELPAKPPRNFREDIVWNSTQIEDRREMNQALEKDMTELNEQ